jgi:YesN/AraC family two-component response regulator
MDGVELYGHIQGVRPGSVTVLVTGFASEDVLRAAVLAGFRRILLKPVDCGDLIPLLEEVAGAP